MWCFMWCRWNIGGTNQHLRWQTGQILVKRFEFIAQTVLLHFNLWWCEWQSPCYTRRYRNEDHCRAITGPLHGNSTRYVYGLAERKSSTLCHIYCIAVQYWSIARKLSFLFCHAVIISVPWHFLAITVAVPVSGDWRAMYWVSSYLLCSFPGYNAKWKLWSGSMSQFCLPTM